MIDERLPTTPEEIDATWLTAALADRHPGVEVAAVEVLERHEATNSHARLRVTYDEPAGAPPTMFCKMPPFDPARRESIARTGMGRREALFYGTLAPALAMRVPAAYAVRYDDADGSFLLLLEDLASTGSTVSDGTWGVRPDAAATALEDLAALHLRFEDPARREAGAAWVPVATSGSRYGANLLRYGLEHHRDRLSDDFAEIAGIYIDRGDTLHDLWQAGPTTVIHGDPHVGNLFDDHGRTGFLDWGLVHTGAAMRDVSYFLNMALSIEDRRRHERSLLNHYLDVRAGGGGARISFDEAWLAHRIHAAYVVPACCQIVTFPAGVIARRRVFSEAFLARAEAAIADLETRAVLRQAANL